MLSSRGARMAAVDLRRDLAARGITARVRSAQVAGRPVLRVIAPAGEEVPGGWQGYQVLRGDTVTATAPAPA